MRRKGDYKASMGEDLRPSEARSSAGGFGTSRFGEAPAKGSRATQNYTGNDELARTGVGGFARGSVDAVPTPSSPSGGGQGYVARPKIVPTTPTPPIMDPPAPVPGEPTPKYPGGPGTTTVDGGATTRATAPSTSKATRPAGFAAPSIDSTKLTKTRLMRSTEK